MAFRENGVALGCSPGPATLWDAGALPPPDSIGKDSMRCDTLRAERQLRNMMCVRMRIELSACWQDLAGSLVVGSRTCPLDCRMSKTLQVLNK